MKRLGHGFHWTDGGVAALGGWSIGIRPSDTVGVEELLAGANFGLVSGGGIDWSAMPDGTEFRITFGKLTRTTGGVHTGVWSDGAAGSNGCRLDAADEQIQVGGIAYTVPGGIAADARYDVSIDGVAGATTAELTIRVNGQLCTRVGAVDPPKSAFNFVNLNRYADNASALDGTLYYFQIESSASGMWKLLIDEGPTNGTSSPEAGGLANTVAWQGVENTDWQWADKPGIDTGGEPTITPTTGLVGQEYSINTGTYTYGGTVTKQEYFRNTTLSLVDGPLGTTYNGVAADAEQTLTIQETVKNLHGEIVVDGSNSATPAALAVPSNTVKPTVQATNLNVGGVISVDSEGTWDSGNPATITGTETRIVRAGVPLATGQDHTLVTADAGLVFECEVRKQNDTGWSDWERSSNNVQANALAAPNVTAAVLPGTIVQGGALTHSTDAVISGGNPVWPGSAPVRRYRWKENGTIIPGETTATYNVPVGATVGNTLVREDQAETDGGPPSAWTPSNASTIQAAGGAWDPDQLFQGAEEGLWTAYEASTLDKTSDGLSGAPVDGDPVGLVRDQSPNSSDFTQGNNSLRPTYRAAWGLEWITQGGVNNARLVSTINPPSSPFEITFGFSWRSDFNQAEWQSRSVFEWRNAGISNWLRFGTYMNGAQHRMSMQWRDGGGSHSAVAISPHDVYAVLGEFSEANTELSISLNNGIHEVVNEAAGGAVVATGYYWTTAGDLDCLNYGSINRYNPLLTTQEKDDLNTWLIDQHTPKPDPDTFDPTTPTGVTLKVWLDPTDLTTMWQERDGSRTTPITGNNQPVGEIVSKDASSVSFRAPSDAARPTFRDDGVRKWLEFNGSDHRLASNGNVAIGTDANGTFSVFFGAQMNDGTDEMMIEHTDNPNTTNQGFRVYVSGANGSFSVGGGTDYRSVRFSDTSVVTGKPEVLSFINRDKETFEDKDLLRNNDVDIGTTSATAGSNIQLADDVLYVGSRGDGSLFANMDLHQMVVYDGNIATTGVISDRENVQRFVAGKTKALPE